MARKKDNVEERIKRLEQEAGYLKVSWKDFIAAKERMAARVRCSIKLKLKKYSPDIEIEKPPEGDPEQDRLIVKKYCQENNIKTDTSNVRQELLDKLESYADKARREADNGKGRS